MKKIITLFFLSLIITTFATGQTLSEDWQDGKIFFKIYNDVKVPMPIKDQTVELKSVEFLSDIIDNYSILSIEKAFNLKNCSENLENIYLMKFSDYNEIDALISELEKIDKIIQYAEKVPLYHTSLVPNDPHYSTTTWGYNWNWHLDNIQAEQAWNITTGSPSIKVAIVDNAIWADHPDLTNKIVAEYNAVTQTAGNSDPPSSVSQNPSSTSLTWSHGTHCAGLVGAETDNNLGVASIGNNVSLMAARAATDAGSLSYTGYGVQWASNNGADVISMSYGGGGYSSSYEQFFQDIKDNGIVLVAAAGNDGVSTYHYPASYSAVISVGAADADDQLASFSQYGSWVDIAAPGGDSPSGSASNFISLLSTTYCEAYALGSVPDFSGEYYDQMHGTSMACPVTAGVIGLMLSLNPALTPDEVLSCLQSTADPMQGGNPISSSGGRINAFAALQCVQATLNNPPIADFNGVPTTVSEGNSVTFTDNSSGTVTSYSWTFPGGTPSTASGIGPHSIQYNTAGQYDAKLVATNSYGSDSITKTNYINVVAPVTGCDTLSNFQAGDSVANYVLPGEGYVSGHNTYNFAEFAEFYTASPVHQLTGLSIAVSEAQVLSSNPIVTLKVWDDNSGEPGTELYTQDLDISTLTEGEYNDIVFTSGITVPNQFYVGYEVYYTSPQDTFAVYMIRDRGSSSPYSSTAFTTYNGSWWNLDDLFTGGFNTGYLVEPVFCPTSPTADFVADNYEGCDNLTVNFTDQSTNTPDEWFWDFGDGDTSIVENPVHQYTSPGTYLVSLIASNDGGADMMTDTIYVYQTPLVDLGNDTTICEADAPYLLDPGTPASYSYQWTGGSTNSMLMVNTTGTYSVTVTNGICSATDNATVTVHPETQINTQPTDFTGCIGDDHSFSLSASGINLSYQWQKDNVDISGAVSDTYTVTNITGADAGDYRCIVAGDCGIDTSMIANLSIGTTTQITTQPIGTTLCEGDSYTLIVTAAGSNLSYQWKQNGTNVGTDSDTYDIPSAAYADAGNYTVDVSGACGIETSVIAVVDIDTTTQILTQPVGATVCLGDDYIFNVIAVGAGLSYQWQKDGVDILGANSDSYIVNSIVSGDAGDYTCIVSGNCGNETSSPASLTIGAPTQITSQPTGSTLCEGDNYTLSVTSTGDNLSYQWQLNGTNIGGNSDTYSISNADFADAGNYTVDVTGTCGNETSITAVIYIDTTTQIITQPVGATVCAGDNYTFTISAVGSGLSYQWQKDGVDISGANSDSYSINGIAAGDLGNYTCVVSGNCGNITSSAANLSMGTGAQITTQPVGANICEGDDHTFTIVATGSNLNYQWKQDGSNVGTNSDTYSVYNSDPSDSGDYTCVVTGDCGSETSIVANLTVDTMPVIVIDPAGPFCMNDAAVTLTAAPTGGTWSGTGISAGDFDPSVAGVGSHSVTYELVNGTCTNSDFIIIMVGNQPSVDTTITDASSSTSADGSAVASASGGLIPYTYEWSNGDMDDTMEDVLPGSYSLTVTDAAGCETILDPIVIDFTNSISKNEMSLEIYPNPANDKLFVEAKNLIGAKIGIINLLGQSVFNDEIVSDITEIDVNKIETGVYFLRIKSEGKELVSKLIIE